MTRTCDELSDIPKITIGTKYPFLVELALFSNVSFGGGGVFSERPDMGIHQTLQTVLILFCNKLKDLFCEQNKLNETFHFYRLYMAITRAGITMYAFSNFPCGGNRSGAPGK